MSKFAIFDIDGTVVDSRQIIHQSMVLAFERADLRPPDYDATRQIVGLSLEIAIDRLAPPDIDHATLIELVEGYKQAYAEIRTKMGEYAPLYTGITEVLEHLRARNWEIGIATGKSHKGLNKVIDGHELSHFFDCRFCADDGPSKPDPFMVDANLKAMSRAPHDAIMIGDTSFDMLMGQAAGVATLAVDWGFHTRDELAACTPDIIVSTMAALKDALDMFEQGQGWAKGCAA